MLLSFVHDKSSSISRFISCNSRKLQRLLRYLSGIVTPTYKAGIDGCGGCCGGGG